MKYREIEQIARKVMAPYGGRVTLYEEPGRDCLAVEMQAGQLQTIVTISGLEARMCGGTPQMDAILRNRMSTFLDALSTTARMGVTRAIATPQEIAAMSDGEVVAYWRARRAAGALTGKAEAPDATLGGFRFEEQDDPGKLLIRRAHPILRNGSLPSVPYLEIRPQNDSDK